MLFLKSCSRRTGDINAYSDLHGTFLKRLQCGFSKGISPEMAAILFRQTTATPGSPAVQPGTRAA